MFVDLNNNHAVLSLNHEVHPGEASEVPVEPDCELASEIDPLGLQVAFYAFFVDPDPSTATAFLMTVAMAIMGKPTAA